MYLQQQTWGYCFHLCGCCLIRQSYPAGIFQVNCIFKGRDCAVGFRLHGDWANGLCKSSWKGRLEHVHWCMRIQCNVNKTWGRHEMLGGYNGATHCSQEFIAPGSARAAGAFSQMWREAVPKPIEDIWLLARLQPSWCIECVLALAWPKGGFVGKQDALSLVQPKPPLNTPPPPFVIPPRPNPPLLCSELPGLRFQLPWAPHHTLHA